MSGGRHPSSAAAGRGRGPAPVSRTANGAGTDALYDLAISGDKRALARLLSVVVEGGDGARRVAHQTFARAGAAYALGVTGAPGSGKSTLTSALVAEVRKARNGKVAVLAVDPSSPVSGGAILGDRIRMQDHALDDQVFIRSLATRGHLGGLAAAVPEAIRLLDATGWPLVVVETVGVGQVEVAVAGTCDTVVVVVNPGWGDSVQASKAGLLEVAHVFVINKADRPGVRETRRDLSAMLELSGHLDWTPPIVETVATTGEGVGELWAAVESHREFLGSGGRLAASRADRWIDETVVLALDRLQRAVGSALDGPELAGLRSDLADRRIDPYEAAERLVDTVTRKTGRSRSGPIAP